MDERISLQRWCPPWVRHQHLTRYRWAARFVEARQVIDAACGTGYGSDILATDGRAAAVNGFDLDADAVAEANARYASEVVHFADGDVTRLPAGDRSCDVYVSFETIEHLPQDEAYLADVVRVLRPDGRFLCSTPNRRWFHPGAALADRPLNPFHVREYDQQDFGRLLARFFGRVEWYGQTRFAATYTRLATAIGGASPWLGARTHQAVKLATLSRVGPARHEPLPLAPGESVEILIAVASSPQ
jgi:SAM-dependent methyltransferase